jgi:hypothetical protein
VVCLLGQIRRMLCHFPRLLRAAEIRQSRTRVVGDPLVCSGFSLSQSRHAFHSRPVTSQKGNVVSYQRKIRDLQFAPGGQIEGVLGLLQAVKVLIPQSKDEVREGKVGIEGDRLPGFFDRRFVLAEDRVNDAC